MIYLLTTTAAALVVPASWRGYVVPALLMLQVVLLLRIGLSIRAILNMAARLRTLFVFLVIAYLLLPAPTGERVIRLGSLPISLNLNGAATAVLMCGQILIVILASAVVRLSGAETDLVDGLRQFRCPTLLVYSIDHTLALLGGFGGRGGGRGRGRGNGGGRGRNRIAESPGTNGPGVFGMLRRLARGDSGVLIEATRAGIRQASERNEMLMSAEALSNRHLAHDVAIISGVALMMISTKILQVLPGMPFASGHKSLILVPLYILAAQLTFSRFGATTAGTILGMLSFLNGDGRFGLLEIPRHIAPGLVIDLLWPLVRLCPSVWAYSVLGIIAAACRVSTEFALTLAIGARWEIYLFPVARIASNLAAGALSGAITAAMLPAFRDLEPKDEPTSEPVVDTVAEPALICE